jgi:gamma-glutamylcyclotransferase (GGCT)/AIG2-like uncharacterized protein YtfP
MDREPTIGLFSYGTLRQREVQLATCGRALEGEPDALAGYRLAPVDIDDPEVVEISGQAVHMIARPTGDPADLVAGMLFWLTPAELAATDAYETSAYARVEVTLESGRTAWVYAEARPPLSSRTTPTSNRA